MSSETFEVLEQSDFTDNGQDLESVDWDSLPTIKPGVKLPKSDDQWKLANDYFAASMPISDLDKTDVELTIETMNSNVYTYFRENCGLLDDSSLSLIMKYKDMSKSVLKSSLKTLKVSNAPLSEIKYVAKCLRSKLQPNTHSVLASKNHDTQIQKNFWGYIKTNF